MKKYFNKKFLLLLIVLLAAFLRFQNLGGNPPALNWDEAAWGYNSYSLGIDGRDEFGRFLPIDYLESYGDFKPPVYAYLGAIPVKIFGLSDFAVRFPSVAAGLLSVVLTYFLVKEIFYKKNKEDTGKGELIALTASFLLAISPWHIMMSRAAFEANVSTFFIILGIFSFLRAINKNPWNLILSAISFALSIYTFNTARVFVPLLVLALAFVFRKNLIERKKEVAVAFLVGFFLILPTLGFLLSPQAQLRFREVNIFSDPSIVSTSNQKIANDHGAVWSKVINNRRVGYAQSFLKHYFDNLGPDFLFIKGDGNPRFSTQDVGELYLMEFPFVIFGLFLLLKNREGHYWLIPVWLLLGIIPAATARETPHALRIETVIPMLQIISAYGLVSFILLFKKHRKVITFLIVLALSLNLLYFYHGYVRHYAREYSGEWQYSYKETVKYAQVVKNDYKTIVVTEELGRPYIYFLLYSKYDPKTFRQNAKIERESYGFVHVKSFDKYKFESDFSTTDLQKGTLYIDVPGHVPSDVKILKKFYNLDSSESLVAYEINK